MTSLVHLASRVYGTPLLIARAKLDTLLAVLGPRIGLAPIEMNLPAVAPTISEPVPTMPGIAVIPIHGTLVRRALGLDAMSGLTSYARIAADLDAALASPDVVGILLDIDYQGAARILAVFADSARLVFILPPSLAVLESRLRGRQTDSEDVITTRLNKARHEVGQYPMYHYLVLNRELRRKLR